MRPLRTVGSVVVLALILAGCQWSQTRFDAGGTANNPFERTIGRGNVTQLRRSWSVAAPAPSAGGFSNLLAKNGRIFASSGAGIEAFDAGTGAPLWSAPRPTATVGGASAVAARPGASDLVLVGESQLGSPLDPKSVGWTTALDAGTGAIVWSVAEGAPGGVLLDGTLFANARRRVGDSSDFDGMIALEVGTGIERFRVAGFTVRAGAGGTIYGDYATDVAALSAGGCGAARCTPNWTADYSDPTWFGDIAVANGSLYLAGIKGLEVFAASGCGAPTCTALWKATGSYGAIAVTNDRLFLNDKLFYAAGPNVLHAFDAHGCGQATCSQLWGSNVGRDYLKPIVANGLVYLSARGEPTEAWSTDGCGSAVCAPVWSTTDVLNVPVTPMVISGRLLLAGAGIATYALPT